MPRNVVRRTVLLVVLAAVILAMVAPPALAAYRTDSGGPNGPCRGDDKVFLTFKYKGDAYTTYRNKDGKYFNVPLPYHSYSKFHTIRTNQDALRWWRVEIVSDRGYVSRDGSYGICA